MGTAARVAGLVVFALFVSVLVVRPIVSNPAVAGVLRDGLDGTGLLLVFPLVVMTLAVVALRLRSLASDEADSHEKRYSVAESSESFWDERRSEPQAGDRSETDDSLAGDTGENGKSGATAASGTDSEAGDQPVEVPDILGGQGGTRKKDFEIEEKPPDATLSDHLDHLQAELDDDETVARDLDTLEEVAREVEGDRTIPERCPQEHCDAVWTGRTVLGIGTERYEVLEDGRRVQCLNCEEIHTLE